MIRALFWDIDGTLLTTKKAGIVAWEDAMEAVGAGRHRLETFPTAGLTDFEVGRRLLQHVAAPDDPATVSRAVDAYETALPARLPLRNGHALPNVREVLACLAGQDDAPLGLLLTGNTRRGAAAKLGHLGLRQWLSMEGGFGDGHFEREDVAREAWGVARARLPALQPSQALVLGDTPHDVRCADAIGVRTLAVATGGHTVEELKAAGAWCAVAVLPPPEDFLALLAAAGTESDA